MVLFPNAKINLGLRILRRRADGYHDIETVFIPVGLCDVLEFVEFSGHNTSITISGVNTDIGVEENLVYKAWQLMQAKFSIPCVDIHLHKKIPLGAGLGGGSADAAFMLTGLNKYFGCGASVQELEKMAEQLGSDCAFFIQNRPAFATGRGETLQEIDLSLSKYTIILVNPGISVNTRDAYADVKPCPNKISLRDSITQPIRHWQDSIKNDFEATVFAKHSQIGAIKNRLIDTGALYAAMSGSGSTVYGIFDQGFKMEQVGKKFPECFVWYKYP